MFSIQLPLFHRTASAGFARASLFAFIVLAIAHVPEVQARHFKLRWADNSNNESGFKIERAAGNGKFSQIATTGPNVVRYHDQHISAKTTYRYRVRAYNRAGHSSYSNTVTVDSKILDAVTNTAAPIKKGKNKASVPTISALADRTIAKNGTTGPLAFTIGDKKTAASKLTLIKDSSNRSLVPLKNISFGGSGKKRTVTVKPAANKTGSATIWVKVSNGQRDSYISFRVTVKSSVAKNKSRATTPAAKKVVTGNSTPTNTAPTITPIADQVVAVNGSTPSLSFKIGDAQTSASNLTLSRNSSDKSVVPVKNIIIGGSGAKRTVTVRPVAKKTGWSTISIKVSDGSLERHIRFKVSVQSGQLTYANIASPNQTEGPVRFGYLPVKGDSEITVRVASLQAGDDRTRAGIMYRASAATNSAWAGVFVTKRSRLVMVSRSATGAALQTSAALVGRAPRWLRLLRHGDMFVGFTSVDGANWDMVEFVTVDLPNTALTGTAATAPGGASQSTARFEHFKVD